jgi:sulfur dioxygenase
MLFQQIRNAPSGAYSYLLGDCDKRIALVIDPVPESQDVVLAVVRDRGLDLRFTLLTHAHPGAGQCAVALRSRTGAAIVVSAACEVQVADLRVDHGDQFVFGDQVVHVIGTPGHTPCSVSYLWRDRLFTGDTLLIGSCGDIVSPGGDPGCLFDSVMTRLFMLPPETLIFPGFDPVGRTVSTIAEEKATNSRFSGCSRDAFLTRMSAVSTPSFSQR